MMNCEFRQSAEFNRHLYSVGLLKKDVKRILQVLWTLLVMCPVKQTVFTNSSDEWGYHGIADDFGYLTLGDIPLLNRKIFKGMRVSVLEHPYIASIRRMYSHYCMGAILNKNVVISVAHPVVDVPINELGIVVGQTYADRGPLISTVVLVIVHEDFDKSTLQNDVALLRVYEDLVFRMAVKSIRYKGTRKLDGAKAFVTGWGRCDRTGKELCLDRTSKYFPDEMIDPILRSVSFNIVHPNVYCNRYKQQNIVMKPGMLCLGPARAQDPVCPCLAVPGTPLVASARLVGLQSWGFGCSYRNDLPLVYSDLKYFRKWLIHNLKIMRSVKREDLSIIFNVTRACFLSQWLEETRLVQPVTTDVFFKDILPVPIDSLLVKLKGSVYDARDFVHSGRYHSGKIELYERIQQRYLQEQNILLNRPNIETRAFLSNGTIL